MIGQRDVTLNPDLLEELLIEKHEKYLRHYADDDSGTEQIMSEYLKMSGMYWCLNGLDLIKGLENESPEVTKALNFIKACQGSDGGFSAAPEHDSHILHTLSAIQILVILGKCQPNYIDRDRCAKYIRSLQQQDGSFFGDKWGEVDTRFSFCALAALKLINKLETIDTHKAVEYVMSCNNQIDGGFGSKPGSESHSAYVYCCVGSLAIAGRLDLVDADSLGSWLSQRQLKSGGLNGRPEKLPDLCYSWWCLASMKMISRMHLINHERLLQYILACQDEELGGFSDRPGNWVDPYHTMFGIASISLICEHFRQSAPSQGVNRTGYSPKFVEALERYRTGLKPVDPVLCMPLGSTNMVT